VIEDLISAAWLLRRMSKHFDVRVAFEQIGILARRVRGSTGRVADDQETRAWVGFAEFSELGLNRNKSERTGDSIDHRFIVEQFNLEDLT